MEDRVPTKPNRVLIRPEDGSPAFYATMTRADEPTQIGDPLNKNTFLKDETAALFGLGKNALPDDVFGLIPSLIDNLKTEVMSAPRTATNFGTYVGNGKTGVQNKNSLSFDFEPHFVVVYPADSVGGPAFFIRDNDATRSGTINWSAITTIWEEKTVSWYTTSTDASLQLNVDKKVYAYFAVGLLEVK